MLDQFIKLVKENADDAILTNPAIPANRKLEAIEVAANTIFFGLKDQANGGNLGAIVGLFQDGNSQVMAAVTTAVTNMFHQKFGLTGRQAAGAALALVPKVISNLKKKSKDPNDKSFELNEVFSALTGGQTSRINMNSVLQNYKGGVFDINVAERAPVADKREPATMMSKLKGFFS